MEGRFHAAQNLLIRHSRTSCPGSSGSLLTPTVLPVFLLKTIELRRRGLVVSQGLGPSFTAWSRVKYGRWSSVSGRLQFQLRFGRAEFDVSEGKKEATLAVLRSLVEIRDDAGCIVNPEFHAEESAGESDTKIATRRFQFNLQTLLLLTLVVSAAMGWYAIRYRRDSAQQAALARLDPFKPQIVVFVSTPTLWLDFSMSSVKPGDRDLPLLSDLARLDNLNLSGADHRCGPRAFGKSEYAPPTRPVEHRSQRRGAAAPGKAAAVALSDAHRHASHQRGSETVSASRAEG